MARNSSSLSISFESAYITFDTDSRITTPTDPVRSEGIPSARAQLDAAFDSSDPFSIFSSNESALGDVEFDSNGWAVRSSDLSAQQRPRQFHAGDVAADKCLQDQFFGTPMKM